MRHAILIVAGVLLPAGTAAAQVTAGRGAPPPPAHEIWPSGVWAGYAAGVAGERRIPQAWHADDPADSLYRAAHALFSRHEYRAAADGYAAVRTRHAESRYYCDAAYYEAFARYRLGTSPDLRGAHAVLEESASRCSDAARRADVPELRARIDAALARQGDAAAAERVRRAASQGLTVCDREEQNVKIQALGALAQMDPGTAAPVLRNVLNTRDECMAPVRRQALGMVARANNDESVALLAGAARSDPDQVVQIEAVRALGRMSSDAAFTALDNIVRTSTNERVHAEAVSMLARSDQARAHTIIRALIDRSDVAERTRISAINSLAARSDVTAEYWRGVYARAESDALRRAVIAALARQNTDDSRRILLDVARNPAQPTAMRQTAIARVQATAPVDDLYGLLAAADSRSLRLAIVNALIARKEPEATDRLIDVARTNTDPEVRAAAIRALGRSPRKEDPRVVRALSEIVGSQP